MNIIERTFKDLMNEEKDMEVIDEISFTSETYPQIEIEQLDMCRNLDENCYIWFKVGAEIKKRELLKLLDVIARCDTLNGVELKYKFIINLLKEPLEEKE